VAGLRKQIPPATPVSLTRHGSGPDDVSGISRFRSHYCKIFRQRYYIGRMAIIGAHMLLYSSEPDAVRDLLGNALGFKSVDAGGGWLIFELPSSELGVHPAEGPTYGSGIRHQITFMCDDIRKTVAELRTKGVQFDGEPEDEGYGITVMMTFPGNLRVMLYEPHHAMAIKPSR
jgi:catechol 2,3-dioxygenase-like lactoylglutathione lyase family enzyme